MGRIVVWALALICSVLLSWEMYISQIASQLADVNLSAFVTFAASALLFCIVTFVISHLTGDGGTALCLLAATTSGGMFAAALFDPTWINWVMVIWSVFFISFGLLIANERIRNVKFIWFTLVSAIVAFAVFAGIHWSMSLVAGGVAAVTLVCLFVASVAFPKSFAATTQATDASAS